MRIVAVYVRVSTTDKGQTVDTQVQPIAEYVTRHEDMIVHNWYMEEVSAVKTRPIFASMMEDARLKKFDTVIVWKIDRFARSTREFLNYIFELDKLRIRFISITQGIDTDRSNPSSRLLMTILGAIAEFERELIKERVNAGIARAKTRGVYTGGRPKVILNIDRVMELHKAGHSVREIAKSLKVSRGVVWLRLKKGLTSNIHAT